MILEETWYDSLVANLPAGDPPNIVAFLENQIDGPHLVSESISVADIFLASGTAWAIS